MTGKKQYCLELYESERGWGSNSWIERFNSEQERRKRTEQLQKQYGGHDIVPDYYIMVIRIFEEEKSMKTCARCGFRIGDSESTGQSLIYDPNSEAPIELHEGCLFEEEQEIEEAGTNNLPQTLAKYKVILNRRNLKWKV